MLVIGVDPGLGGGIAFVNGDTAAVFDMPTLTREAGWKRVRGERRRVVQRRIDAAALARLLGDDAIASRAERNDVVAFVERAQATPQMGVSSAFHYGEGFGLVCGVLAQARVRVRLITPVVWKRALGLLKPGAREIGRDEERDKSPALELARELYPQQREQLCLAKHDGRAEALLVAHYGCELLEDESAPAALQEVG